MHFFLANFSLKCNSPWFLGKWERILNFRVIRYFISHQELMQKGCVFYKYWIFREWKLIPCPNSKQRALQIRNSQIVSHEMVAPSNFWLTKYFSLYFCKRSIYKKVCAWYFFSCEIACIARRQQWRQWSYIKMCTTYC